MDFPGDMRELQVQMVEHRLFFLHLHIHAVLKIEVAVIDFIQFIVACGRHLLACVISAGVAVLDIGIFKLMHIMVELIPVFIGDRADEVIP